MLPSSTLDHLLDMLSPARRVLAEIRATWAQVGTKDGWLASRYFDLTRTQSVHHVDDKTWVDLELPRIFSNLDTAVTPLGSQVLFNRLRAYADNESTLDERYEIYERLRSDRALREQIQLKLAYLRDDTSASIAGYVFGRPPEKPKYHGLVPYWSLVSVATLVAVLVSPLPAWVWFLVVAINAAIIYFASLHLHRDTETLRACNRMLRAADGLSALRANDPALRVLSELADEAPLRATARRELLWFSISQNSVILWGLLVWLNLAFVAEQAAYFRTIDRFPRFRSTLASTFELVGSLDAAIAIASFLERCPQHCRPQVTDTALIDIEQGRHPLIAEPVPNSIRLDGRSALITGSNMAGKTTFIKMVGINLIFGRTLGFCLATKAVAPRSSVMAVIRGEHSVESGKSHYFAEIEAILSFIESARRGDCRVFVIDELFSGTNTVERIAAARAVLESISTKAQVLVTTHDVELQAQLAERFDLYHFQEDPDVEGFFDFELRPGATRERNALRLLERLGFPGDVVASARAFIDEDT